MHEPWRICICMVEPTVLGWVCVSHSLSNHFYCLLISTINPTFSHCFPLGLRKLGRQKDAFWWGGDPKTIIGNFSPAHTELRLGWIVILLARKNEIEFSSFGLTILKFYKII